MCFSAGASLVASGGLAVLGGASFKVAKKEEKILALMPIAFAIQQGLEGVQWLMLGKGCTSLLAGYGFLFFAFIFWPVYVPVTVYILDKKKGKILKWLIALGICLALFFIFLFATEPITILSVNKSILYNFNLPFYYLIAFLYVCVILLPLALSKKHAFHLFALLSTIAAFISFLFFYETFTSVWCFFSAFVSGLVYFYLKRELPVII